MTVMVIPETVVMGAGGNDGAEGPDHDAVMEDDGDDGDGGGDGGGGDGDGDSGEDEDDD